MKLDFQLDHKNIPLSADQCENMFSVKHAWFCTVKLKYSTEERRKSHFWMKGVWEWSGAFFHYCFTPLLWNYTWNLKADLLKWSLEAHTFVGHPRAGFKVEPLAVFGENLLDIIAQCVTAVLSTVQANTFVKSIVVTAPVGHALLVIIQ